jgi:hypothetical protein
MNTLNLTLTGLSLISLVGLVLILNCGVMLLKEFSKLRLEPHRLLKQEKVFINTSKIVYILCLSVFIIILVRMLLLM